MNSWRRSSVMSPVAVSVAIAVRHSSSVNPTSVTKAWRWRTSACMTSRRRGSSQPAKLASTAAVMSAGVVRPAAVSGEVMRRFCRRRQGVRGAAALWAPRPAMRVSAATRPGMASRPVGSRPHMSATSSTTVAARLDRIPPIRMHKRMAVAVGFANFFDLYDIFLGGVLAAVLAEEWGLGTSGKALVIASGFGGMFFGAILLGTLADYLGRRRMFLINLMIYSGFSLAAAFSPNLAWLAILRFCAGFGLGSELSLSDTYLSELLPRQVRGRYMAGAYTLGFFGVPLAALIGAKFVAGEHLLIDGWRWLLVVGSLGAVVVWTMRRNLPESPRWHEIRGRHDEADRATRELEDKARADLGVERLPEPEQVEVAPAKGASISQIFRPPYRQRTVMLYIFQFLQTVGYYGFGTLAPLVLADKGYDIVESLGFSAVIFLGYPLGRRCRCR